MPQKYGSSCQLCHIWHTVFICFTSNAFNAQKLDPKNLEQACNKHVDAIFRILGAMYYHDEGLNQDKVKAAELFSKACDDKTNPNAIANACFYLGRMYHNAVGVAQNSF